MFKQNILKLRYCAFKMSLMSNLNSYIFPLTFKLENVKKCHSQEISCNVFKSCQFKCWFYFNFVIQFLGFFSWENKELFF